MTSRRVARDGMPHDVVQLGFSCRLLRRSMITGYGHTCRLQAETKSDERVLFVRVGQRHYAPRRCSFSSTASRDAVILILVLCRFWICKLF